MKVLVTGVCGQLGHDVMNELIARGHKALGSDIHEKYSGADDGTPVTTAFYKSVDITDSEAVEAAIVSLNPDAVIHCAAWTAVDAAEDEENKTKVMNINAVGTRNSFSLRNDQLQNDVYQYRLCIQWSGRAPMASGLQRLRPT
jgi:dTDP-4-dehydrorhamnose reductase